MNERLIFLYKSNKIITSDDFNRIFDQYIQLKPDEQSKAIVSRFYDNITNNTLMEFATESQLNPKVLMAEMQWNEIGNHFREMKTNLNIEGCKEDNEQKTSEPNAKKEENQAIIKEIEGFNFFKKYFSKYEFLFNEKNKFIKDYSNLIGEFTDQDSLRQKPEDAKTYMKYFAEISKYVNINEKELLQFIVIFFCKCFHIVVIITVIKSCC